jgi:hypothetical protein
MTCLLASLALASHPERRKGQVRRVRKKNERELVRPFFSLVLLPHPSQLSFPLSIHCEVHVVLTISPIEVPKSVEETVQMMKDHPELLSESF